MDLAYVLTKLGSKLLVEIFINLLVERKVSSLDFNSLKTWSKNPRTLLHC